MRSINSEKELTSYLDEYEAKLEKLATRIGELSYQRFLDKKPNPALVELKKERGRLALDPTFHEIIQKWSDKEMDLLLQRRVEVWNSLNRQAKVSAHPEVMDLVQELDEKIVTHKYKYGEERVELGEIRNHIKGNHDTELRKQAWLANQELSEQIEQKMLALFKLRNRLSRDLGYETYVDLILDGAGMTKQEVTGILTELTGETQRYYQDYLRQGADSLNIEQIQPWDVQYILDQQAGDTTVAFPREKITSSVYDWAKGMGYDLKELGLEMVFVDIPYNGLCMGIGRHAVKVLGNPKDGYSYYRTSFHEMGHALHHLLNGQEHFGLRREPSVFNEGMAETFGYITHHPDWIKSFGIREQEVNQILKGAIGPQFHYLRQRTAFCLFEYACYENPDQDLNKLLAEIERTVLGVEYDETPRWAANAWFVNYPVYWQNYVLADVIASQVHHAIEKDYGALYQSKDALEKVIDTYIKPGASIPWQQKILQGTGSYLKATALIKDMTPSV
ncbi:M3 family metallopeptidase [Bacillus horti]|uniref:Peptidyl-dipeptidase A n=1 Tax=Caldalkalibacillus horti TaxID=77523 RepID=A0ABT9W3D8_9BACI|nr:M3 family metallopeptidase [Bacillus horti]MDQ0167769.1 peptidyl-dipeptidase A [Bacillus horti]